MTGHGRHGLLRRFLQAREGISAIEFAIFAPMLLLILVATVDLGALIYTRMQIENALSTATAYAFANPDSVSGEGAETLGTTLTQLLVSRLGADIEADVNINNGARYAYAKGQTQHSGSSAQAGQCYCTVRNGSGALTWSSASCDQPCSAGGNAGKFIAIAVRKPYSPLFFDYGLIEDGNAAGAVVAEVP